MRRFLSYTLLPLLFEELWRSEYGVESSKNEAKGFLLDYLTM